MQSVVGAECLNENEEVEIKERKKSNSKFPKLWSEEDEITLLSGYHEYQEKKGKFDFDVGGFYQFIKHRLIRSSVKQSQVSDKICRLKKKYMDHASKSDNLHDVVDPHLQKLLQLSTKIWCIDGNNSNNIVDENIFCPLSLVDVKFDLSNNFMCEEFLDFLFNEGVDVDLLDTERVTDLKRKFGLAELSKSKFEYKQAKLSWKLEKLKYHHYKRALDKFFN